MPKIFDLDFLSTSTNNTIILHKNIHIILNCFLEYFGDELYNKLKEKNNRNLLKSELTTIFFSSTASYLYESAKEQERDINYVNNIVANKDYTKILDKILNLNIRYNLRDRDYKSFNKVLFDFSDFLLEYCGLRDGSLFKNGNNTKETDKILNTLAEKYKLKYTLKQLELFFKIESGLYNGLASKQEELIKRKKNLVELVKKYKDNFKLFDNKILFDKLKSTKDTKAFIRVFRQAMANNKIKEKITEGSFKDIAKKITKIALLAKAIKVIKEMPVKAISLAVKKVKVSEESKEIKKVVDKEIVVVMSKKQKEQEKKKKEVMKQKQLQRKQRKKERQMEEARQKMEEIMSVWSDAQRNTRENTQENAQENGQESGQENTRKPIQMQSDTRRNIHTDTQRQPIQQQRNPIKTEQEPKAGEVLEGVEDASKVQSDVLDFGNRWYNFDSKDKYSKWADKVQKNGKNSQEPRIQQKDVSHDTPFK